MNFFDTHAHLNAEQFDGSLVDVIARAREESVSRINVVGTTLSTLGGLQVTPAGPMRDLLLCGLPSLSPPFIGIIYMLNHSIWQARCNADNGDVRTPKSWTNWIVTGVLHAACTQPAATHFYLRHPERSGPGAVQNHSLS